MGVKERRERERNELRERIMDAARELILAQGVEAVSMRKIAERIEYSPTAIYQHFADKEALLRAMCERDFDALGEELGERAARASDPVERIVLLGEGYVRFAVEFPEHFRLMFLTPQAVPREMTEADRQKQGNPEVDGYANLRLAVREAIDGGRFRDGLADADVLAQTFWATVHGVAAIEVIKADDPWLKLAPFAERVRVAVDGILRGLLKDPSEVEAIRARREGGTAGGGRRGSGGGATARAAIGRGSAKRAGEKGGVRP